MIYVISKYTTGDYNVRDIQCNANWDCCPYSDYALIPDNLVAGILGTEGYCDITLDSDKNEVVSFTPRTIPSVPRECCGENTVLSVNGRKANTNGEVTLDVLVAEDPNNDGNVILRYAGGGNAGGSSGGGSGTGGGNAAVTDEQIANAVSNYMAENPIDVGVKTVNGVSPDKNGNVDVAGGASSNVLYEYDHDKEYTEKVANGAGGFVASLVKISNDAPDSSYFIGKTLYIDVTDSNGRAEAANLVITDEMISAVTGGYYVANAVMVVTADETDSFADVTLTKGIWLPDDYADDAPIKITKMQILSSDAGGGSSSGGGVTSWNDIQDKPFGEDVVIYEYDRNKEYTEVVEDNSEDYLVHYVKISDDVPEPSFFVGKTLKGFGTVNDEDSGFYQVIEEDDVLHEEAFDTSDAYMVLGFIVVTADSVNIYDAVTLTKGVWYEADFLEKNGDYSITDTYVQVIVPGHIDESVIPDTIARVEDLMILRSPNGTKFQITVDDNGNLSATQVE